MFRCQNSTNNVNTKFIIQGLNGFRPSQYSPGRFFGFKLHLVITDRGGLLNVTLTPGNVDNRKPVSNLIKDLFGKLFADKGCISQPLFELLLKTFDIQLITKLRSNTKNRSNSEVQRFLRVFL